MNYELALNAGGWGAAGGLIAWIFYRVVAHVRQSKERRRAMAAVYARHDHVEVQRLPIGLGVRTSRVPFSMPMPDPRQRVFSNPELGEPFEWVADKDDVDGHA